MRKMWGYLSYLMQFIFIVSGLGFLLITGGCGSGGGSSNIRPGNTSNTVIVRTPPPTTPVQIDPASFRTSEFTKSYNLGAIGAEYAYAEGLSGNGVTIGVLDFNFDLSSTEVNYTPASTGPNQTYIDMYEAQIGDTAPDEPHGHAIAVIAAGARNMIDTQGVAYNSSVLAVDYFSGVNITQIQQGGITYHFSNPYTYMTDRGAKIINISIGYDESDLIANPPDVAEKYVLDSPVFAIDRGAVLVASAGNSGDVEPMLSDLEIMDDATSSGSLNSGRGAFIIVGSVNESNIISDFSDRAGRAQDIYLVAPGEQIVFPFSDETGAGLFIGDGTSLSAPQVAGAAAILYERWPQLSGEAIAGILFDTATDLGDPGTDAVYGHGLLNLRAAVEPIGTVTTAISGSDVATPIDQLGMVIGPAFGDARPYEFGKVMGLDSYGRDYYYDLDGQIIERTNTELNLADIMDYYRDVDAASFPLAAATGSLYVVENHYSQSPFESWRHHLITGEDERKISAFILQGTYLGWSWQLGKGTTMSSLLDDRIGAPYTPLTLKIKQYGFLTSGGIFAAAGYALSPNTQITAGIDMDTIEGIAYHPNANLRKQQDRLISALQLNHSFQKGALGIRLGAIFDEDGVLGSRGVGGFGISDGSTTGFVSLKGYYEITPAISLEGNISTGMTWVRNIQEIRFFTDFNDFFTTSWSIQLQGKDLGVENSNWTLGVTQPLRVENARLAAKIATRIDIATGIPIYKIEQLPFTPSGREMAIEAAWQYHHDKWMIQANLLNRLDAGHVAGHNDPTGMVWYKLGF